MKTARYYVGSVEITCPECNQGIREPDSESEFWTMEELARHRDAGPFTCPECSTKFKLPNPRNSTWR